MSQNAFGGRIGSHGTSKIQHQISLLTPQFSSQSHPPSLQPRAGGGEGGENLLCCCFRSPPPDSWEGMAKSTAVHGNPGSSVQSRRQPTQAAWGDAPQGGHFPQGLLKE